MRWRRKRTLPTVTELSRVQRALEREPALRRLLKTKTSPVRTRSGDMAFFSPETVAVAEAMMALKLNPERAALGQVLVVAGRVLGISRNL